MTTENGPRGYGSGDGESRRRPANQREFERRLQTYLTMRRGGASQREARRVLRLSAAQGTRYEGRYLAALETDAEMKHHRIIDKEALAERLSRAIDDPDTPKAYIAPLSAQLSRLMSYENAPPEDGKEKHALIVGLFEKWAADQAASGRCPGCGRGPSEPQAESTHGGAPQTLAAESG